MKEISDHDALRNVGVTVVVLIGLAALLIAIANVVG